MKTVLALIAILLAGCTSQVEGPQSDPVPDAAPAPALPASFTKSHGAGSNLMVGVGGVALSHDFELATNATLHYYVAWGLPEPSVELFVVKDGQRVDGETLTAQQGGRLDRSVELQPGKYTATARLTYGTGTLKSFEMGGHFA